MPKLTPDPARPRVLYVVYWGALEPLGQALVVPAVSRLAELGARLTLVTFEKGTDLSRKGALEELRAVLRDRGITWVPLAYHKGPQIAAKTWDVLNGAARAVGVGLRGRIDVVHARTFLGGVMGLLMAPALGARLIFHNEGFYPDEQVDGGVWTKGSFIHRVARGIEERLYRRADGIIALSNRAREVITRRQAEDRVPTVVVPSAVDLKHFHCRKFPRDKGHRTLRLVYVGAIGRRYLFHDAARFAAAAQRLTGSVHLRVLSRTEPAEVAKLVDGSGLDAGDWSLASLRHAEMPQELARHDAGLFFLTRGLSEHGCSPTKIGEYWAGGLPVVTTPNVGDTDEITRRDRVGVILADHSDEAYEGAVRELLALLEDPSTPERCRRAAETHYSLDDACRRQLDLYAILTSSAITR